MMLDLGEGEVVETGSGRGLSARQVSCKLVAALWS